MGKPAPKFKTDAQGRRVYKGVSYAKWGYIFILPFFIVYAVFFLYPLISTITYSFFEYRKVGGTVDTWTDKKFIGLENYKTIINDGIIKYFKNTVIIWLIGFVPQIIFSLLFASWFTDLRLKLKATGFFKVVMYMPNLIMASAMSILFFALFADRGPVNDLLAYVTNNTDYFSGGDSVYRWFASIWGVRGIAGLANFLMWYGNTTILLMAAIMGVDPALYEAAEIDGASPGQMFRKITIPLIKPILIYVLVTSLIGGLQMFDIPQLLTNGGKDCVDRTAMTVVMYLNSYLTNKNYGVGGAISVLLFLVAVVLSILVFLMLDDKEPRAKKGGKK